MHLDEIVVSGLACNRMYLWRPVDHEGEVLTCCFIAGATSGAALRL